ncbi:MAG: AAA family ATPase [Methylomonas sp.]|jgi:5-methylcytosine-specific restriction protein B|uniref:AAA family ATPase n=1 Tax=Methylomonas sp. TaxID=418 RepID=UPI0025CFB44C|nr:AAA family ATPase [Methylomonas sp.]MCK9608045.1 AAA family ATPase [Methylomonas sp.]
MSEKLIIHNSLWDEFLAQWPLDHLSELTLDEYSKPGTQDGFTYWLETKTEDLGSVWGGSSFKFGIYRRSNKNEAINGRGLIFGDIYAWYSKYGSTPEEAFKNVKAEILKVAEASRERDLTKVDDANLGDAIKWKVAFLYQDREKPCVLPIYKAENLRAIIGPASKNLPCSSLHEQLMQQRGGRELFAYADQLWNESQKILAEKLTHESALEYLQNRFKPIKDPVKYMAGFFTTKGRQLGLVGRGSIVSLFLEPGDWPALVPGVSLRTRFSANTPRINSLEANVPELNVGKPADQVDVHTMNELIGLCDAYDDMDDSEDKPVKINTEAAVDNNASLNQILYGPPGTGKTYATINEALRILDPDFLEKNRSNRKHLKERFDHFVGLGQVRFTTFHQSFSYEDFVEGLRAELDEDSKQLNYYIEDGIFKLLCNAAREKPASNSAIGVSQKPRVWKISIDRAGNSTTRNYCLTNGEARIGWGHVGDIRHANLDDPKWELGSNDRSCLQSFGMEVAPGDILLCIRSVTNVAAIGVVQGEYRYEPSVPSGIIGDYNHVLPVNWVLPDIDFSILSLNGQKRFTLKTVYELTRFTWEELERAILAAGYPLPKPSAAIEQEPKRPYVLIIDEINRGNVSRILGELITLIEHSKRSGSDEVLEVVLPYSKKRFSVPDNVYLIGTMNTADRSLAGLDIALRRRFTFKEMPPRPDLLDEIDIDDVNIGELLRTMNNRIEVLLDRDHCLGHAYFMSLLDDPSLDELSRIFTMNILPLLQEYFFEDWERIVWVLNDQRKPNEQKFVQNTSGANLDSLSHLFGAEIAESLQDRRWHINEGAFSNIESYRGIIGVGG